MFKHFFILTFAVITLWGVGDLFNFAFAQSKDVNKKESSKAAPKQTEEQVEEEEDINPAQTYKLIAIYLVENQPRALIRNENKPEQGARDYKVGEYLDELKTVSISKISFTPTARVELIDKSGLTYLMKPYSLDESTPHARGATSSKTYATYSSSPATGAVTKPKTKSKNQAQKKEEGSQPSEVEKPATSTLESAIKQESAQETQPAEAPKEEASSPSIQPATQPQAKEEAGGPQAKAPAQDKASQQEAKAPPQPSPQGASSEPDNGLDVSRPTDPFATE